MQKDSIIEFKQVDIPIDKVKLDPENPNEMTDNQMEQARESMRTLGFLEPIIVDQNFVMADGEHRLLIYKEFKKKTIPGYVVQCESDYQRRMIRQAKNKIHGEHLLTKDVVELSFLLAEKPELTEKIMHIDERTISDMRELAEFPDRNTWEEYFSKEDLTEEKDMVQVTFYLKTNQRDRLLKLLKTIDKDKEKALMKVAYAWRKNS